MKLTGGGGVGDGPERVAGRRWRPAPRRARPTLSLNQHLGLLTLVVALPLIVLSFFMVGRFAESERQARRAFLVAATHSLADAVETELDRYFVISNALAHSTALLQGDIPAFAKTASEMLSSLPDASLKVVTPGGETILDTVRRPTTIAAAEDVSPSRASILVAGAPALSDLHAGTATQAPFASVDTPFARGDRPVYVMTLDFSPRRLSELLKGQKYPDGWIAGIVDGSGNFIARDPEGPGRPGTRASASFMAAIARSPEGISDNVSLEGKRVISAHARIGYGWTVGVAAEEEVLDQALSRDIWLLSLLAAGSLVVSLALSVLANRRLSFGVRVLQTAAKDIGESKPVTYELTGVQEFDELSLAFSEASALLHERAIQRMTAEVARSASEERFRLLADSLPQLVWTAQPDGTLDYTNARREKYGRPGVENAQWSGVIHPDDRRATVAAWRKAIETGAPYEMEHRLLVIGKGFSWHLSRATLLRDSAGKALKWYGTTMDIHEHKMREEHVRVLMTEVNHRSKNLLAVTQAIARQTVASSSSAAEFEQKFSGRLLGLAASQDLLTQEQWRGVRLDALIRSQTGRYSDAKGGRIKISGPETQLNSTATQAIGMALHELSTNAAHYGALSGERGYIEVSWRIDRAEAPAILELTWRECEGPAVAPPRRQGFGSIVIEGMLAQRLNATVDVSFAAEGLEWRMRVPLETVEASDDAVE